MSLKKIKTVLMESKTSTIKQIKNVINTLDRLISTKEVQIDVPMQKRLDYIFDEVNELKNNIMNNLDESMGGRSQATTVDKIIYLLKDSEEQIKSKNIVLDIYTQKQLDELYRVAYKFWSEIENS